MKYTISERMPSADGGRTAWSKARADAETIAAAAGYEVIPITPYAGDRVSGGLREKLRGHFAMGRIWKAALGRLSSGDTLFLQLPVIHNSLFLAGALRRARRRGVRIIGLVHDLELLRMGLDDSLDRRSRLRMRTEEAGVLKACDRLIVHNEKMRWLMAQKGVPHEKMIPLGIFDYLVAPAAEAAVRARTPARERRLIAAGNLRRDKAGYIYACPDGVGLELYGMFYEGGDTESYHGAFAPEELPARLEGGFGLVWDGPSADTCRGVYGEYLRYNNPHKTSLYLASGLPVVIWDQAALAPFIEEEKAGFSAASIAAAAERAAAMPADEYEEMFQNAAAVGARLRRGEFLRAAIAEAEG